MSDPKTVCRELEGSTFGYCVAMAESCQNAATPGFELDMMDGDKEPFKDVDRCQSFARFKAKLGVPQKYLEIAGGRSAEKRSTKPAQKKGEGRAQPKRAQKEAALPTGPVMDACDGVAKKDSPAGGYCAANMAICASKAEGPYELNFDGTAVTRKNQGECKSFVLYMTKVFKMNNPDPANEKEEAGPAVRDVPAFEPDWKTTFAATFSDVGFSPEKTDGVHLETLDLLFHTAEGVRGMKAYIAYKLEPSGGGNFVIRYKISDERLPKDIEEGDLSSSHRIAVDGDMVRDKLCFAVTLGTEMKFSSVRSIEIGKL